MNSSDTSGTTWSKSTSRESSGGVSSGGGRGGEASSIGATCPHAQHWLSFRSPVLHQTKVMDNNGASETSLKFIMSIERYLTYLANATPLDKAMDVYLFSIGNLPSRCSLTLFASPTSCHKWNVAKPNFPHDGSSVEI